AGLAIHAVHPFAIRQETFAREERVEAPITPSRTHRRVGLQPREKFAVIDPSAAGVPPRRRTQGKQPTRAAQLRVRPFHPRLDRAALRGGPSPSFATPAFNAWMSSVCSATICFRRRFSSSSCLRRCISLSSIPPYFAFQR